ncbi:uncharacterized protein LOC108845180 [Raphanus sativus]|uniref:Uncharacterized protein LOC108845180 n=1 Tax=Raphanus sativus TaxID=3726 RepID=A0A6J0MPV4_RAPSA|nr:uncharacterized protein LOC108845180 [Raphanus sativus]
MNLNKVFETMSLEEEDVPVNLPDLPQFSAVESNMLSIIGRTLNPDCQKMKDLILDMPRKWQVYDIVRGVALSPTMFQFIFKYEHDLEEVMRKRVWTFNEWSIVIDRWMEKPPDDYLKYLLVWVQIRNIPVNHYTKEAIEAFADILGKVDVVTFDPSKAQRNDYVRARIFFDVSRPVRKTKVFNIPRSDAVTIRYDFERLQKRCYHCQRLTHEKDKCPLLIQERRDQAVERRRNVLAKKQRRELMIQRDDPLFGVLSDEQVGLDSVTERRKINHEVLQNMREYLLAADEDKDKGHIFDYSFKSGEKNLNTRRAEDGSNLQLNADGIVSTWSAPTGLKMTNEVPLEGFECSTGFSSGFMDANSSRTARAKIGKHYRPPKRMRKFKTKPIGPISAEDKGKRIEDGVLKSSGKKRAEEVAEVFVRAARRSKPEVVPNGGLPDQ